MKRLLLVLGVLALGSSDAWAVCRSDQKLAIVGTLATDSAVIASAAKEARLIGVTCGGSACLAGIYDASTLGTASSTTVRFEITAPANTTVFLPPDGFSDQPITFSTGVTFVDDGNVSAVSVFDCADR